jgi:hypothetical protein
MQIMTVSAMTDRINAIQEVTRKKMINEVHYGIIPGTQKPTLYKAGSEMLLTMFNIGPTIRVEDLSTPAGIKYRVIVTGVHTPSGTPIGEGVGECSSNEEKYRWRNAVCQAEFDATPEEQRRIKWGRGRGGSTYTSQQIRTNPDDLGNTVLKMAKKRAQIDMTLTALGVSDLFSQDVEDLPPELRQTAGDSEPGAPEHASAGEGKVDPLAQIRGDGHAASKQGMVALTAWWAKLSAREQKELSGDFSSMRKAARSADSRSAE